VKRYAEGGRVGCGGGSIPRGRPKKRPPERPPGAVLCPSPSRSQQKAPEKALRRQEGRKETVEGEDGRLVEPPHYGVMGRGIAGNPSHPWTTKKQKRRRSGGVCLVWWVWELGEGRAEGAGGGWVLGRWAPLSESWSIAPAHRGT
jgi:hypothetical protein